MQVFKMGSADVIEALCPLLLKHGKPEYLRSDNGPEFIAAPLQEWLTRWEEERDGGDRSILYIVTLHELARFGTVW